MTRGRSGLHFINRICQLGADWRCAPAMLMVLMVASLLAACGGGGSAAPANKATATNVASVFETATSVPTTKAEDSIEVPTIDAHDDFDKPCDDGALSVAEVGKLDNWWQSTLAKAQKDATAWQADATFNQGSILCYFGDQPEWSAGFKSESAQTARMFPEDNGLASIDLSAIDPAQVSFATLHDNLITAGYTDETLLVEIDFGDVFAPANAEPGVFYYRVGKYQGPGSDASFVTVSSRDGSFEFSDF
jgi:hypothetical protein